MTFELVDVFTHEGRICAIVKVTVPELSKKDKYPLSDWHNGYVQVLPHNIGKDYNNLSINIIDRAFGHEKDDIYQLTQELTFGGDLDYYNDERIPKGTYFFGFDTAHVWNDEKPESKTYESVKEATIKLAAEFRVKNI